MGRLDDLIEVEVRAAEDADADVEPPPRHLAENDE